MTPAQRLMAFRHYANGSTPTAVGHSLSLPAADITAVLAEVDYSRTRAAVEARALRRALVGRIPMPLQPSAFPKSFSVRVRRNFDVEASNA